MPVQTTDYLVMFFHYYIMEQGRFKQLVLVFVNVFHYYIMEQGQFKQLVLVFVNVFTIIL